LRVQLRAVAPAALPRTLRNALPSLDTGFAGDILKDAKRRACLPLLPTARADGRRFFNLARVRTSRQAFLPLVGRRFSLASPWPRHFDPRRPRARVVGTRGLQRCSTVCRIFTLNGWNLARPFTLCCRNAAQTRHLMLPGCFFWDSVRVVVADTPHQTRQAPCHPGACPCLDRPAPLPIPRAWRQLAGTSFPPYPNILVVSRTFTDGGCSFRRAHLFRPRVLPISCSFLAAAWTFHNPLRTPGEGRGAAGTLPLLPLHGHSILPFIYSDVPRGLDRAWQDSHTPRDGHHWTSVGANVDARIYKG